MKKELLSLSLMSALLSPTMGQNKMYVWQNGQAEVYEVANVDSVTFRKVNTDIEQDENAMPSDAKTLASKIVRYQYR